jgi:hypothetical protein
MKNNTLPTGEKEEWKSTRTRIISEMLYNPDKYGIYPTTKCFNELDKAVAELVSQARKEYFEKGFELGRLSYRGGNTIEEEESREKLMEEWEGLVG